MTPTKASSQRAESLTRCRYAAISSRRRFDGIRRKQEWHAAHHNATPPVPHAGQQWPLRAIHRPRFGGGFTGWYCGLTVTPLRRNCPDGIGRAPPIWPTWPTSGRWMTSVDPSSV